MSGLYGCSVNRCNFDTIKMSLANFENDLGNFIVLCLSYNRLGIENSFSSKKRGKFGK